MRPEVKIMLDDLIYHMQHNYNHNMDYDGDFEDGTMTVFQTRILLEETIQDVLVWYCLDCSVNCNYNDEYYMVHDSVWLQANPGIDGMLCIACLEARLERELDSSDFTDCPLNEMNQTRGSELLKSRLTVVREVKWQ